MGNIFSENLTSTFLKMLKVIDENSLWLVKLSHLWHWNIYVMVCIQIKLEKIILIKALLKKQGIKSNLISKLNWWPLSTIRKILQIINIYFLGKNRKSFFNDSHQLFLVNNKVMQYFHYLVNKPGQSKKIIYPI